ncbi:hypothetical protein UPYG_G00018120 [Umbra pygmaea]|uniref:Methyl-CpG binding domain protein 5 n=1 Tax=Umbra pygmaea TaxID=75934 RepID=A0ABD0XK67_UMBPY
MSNQNAINAQHGNSAMYPPATSSGSPVPAPPSGQNLKAQHPGLLGMPLTQILNQHNAASFPASSLLSAAAKAQLANQNKHGDSTDPGGGGCGMDGGAVGANLGGVNGTRSTMDRHGSMLPPNSTVLTPSVAETVVVGGQSGRAALRDKLMAQQRDRVEPLVRKRKQLPGLTPPNNTTLNHHDSLVYNMLNKTPNAGGPGPRPPPPSSAEQLRKVARLGGLTPNTSMAQLLQSMSNQNRHVGPTGPVAPGQMHYSDAGAMGPNSGASQQNLLAQQRMLGQVEGQSIHCQSMDAGGHGGPRPHGPQFPGLMNHIQGSSLGACGPLGPGGKVGSGLGGLPLSHHPSTIPPPLSHQGPHQPQHNHLHAALSRTSVSAMTLGSSDGSCVRAVSESGEPTSLVNCSMGNMVSLPPHVISSNSGGGTQVFQQHHAQQQQLHLGMQPVMQGLPGPSYHGSSQQLGLPDNSFPDNCSSNPMAGHFQNFQGCLPDNSISVHHSQSSSQTGMTSLPESQGMLSRPHFGDSQREIQQTQGDGLPPGMHGSDRLPGGGVESIDAIYRAVVDAASKGMHVVITTTVSGTTQSSPVPALSAMSAFANSIGEPVAVNHNLQHSQAAVSRSAPRGELPKVEQNTSQQPRPRQARTGRPRKNSGQGKGTIMIPEGQGPLPETPHQEYYRSPGHSAPRGQWDVDTTGQSGGTDSGHAAWGGEEFLECSTHVRSSPCMERPGSLAPAPSCPADGGPHDGHHHHPLAVATDKAYLEDSFSRFNSNCSRASVNIVNYKDRLEQTVERCAHMNGGGLPQFQFSLRGYGDPLGPPRQGDLTGDDQSPSSSTSLEGPLVKEYAGHYNGHFNGGCAPSPSDTKSLSSEEDLRHPDSPSSEMLHYRPRTFNMGDLVWGQGFKGFPSWPGKLAGEETGHNHHNHHSSSIQLREQGKVEPEKLKTLTHDLEALDRATKRNRKAGKLNNHLEAAIHEAMSELDKMSGTVHQIPSRDRQVKLPKPKRRKISR